MSRTSLVAIVASGLALTAVAGAAQSEAQEAGYLIVGELPSVPGLGSGDSLREVLESEVNARVRSAAALQVVRFALQKNCSRYFSSTSIVIAIIGRDCMEGEVPRDDADEGVLIFTQCGELLGRPLFTNRLPPNAISVYPVFRIRAREGQLDVPKPP